jgi:YD repeat-containing protein
MAASSRGGPAATPRDGPPDGGERAAHTDRPEPRQPATFAWRTLFHAHDNADGLTLVDPLRRLQRAVEADGPTREWIHAGHRVTERLLGVNGDPGQVAETTRWTDARSRTWKVVTPAGGTDAWYRHDVNDLLVGVDLDGQVRTFVRDALGLLRSRQEPESGTTGYPIHDAMGRLVQSVDARGVVIERTYDAAGRPRTVSSRDGSATTLLKEWRHDEPGHGAWASGQVTTLVSPGVVTESRWYDGLSGRLSSVVHDFGSWQVETELGHDALGLVGEIAYPHPAGSPSPWTLRLDRSWGLLDRVRDFDGRDWLADLAYSPAGGVASITHGNGARTVTAHDARNRVASIEVLDANGISTWRSGTYRFDGAGSIVAIGLPGETPAPTVTSSSATISTDGSSALPPPAATTGR